MKQIHGRGDPQPCFLLTCDLEEVSTFHKGECGGGLARLPYRTAHSAGTQSLGHLTAFRRLGGLLPARHLPIRRGHTLRQIVLPDNWLPPCHSV